MANVDFFAVRADLEAVITAIVAETDVRIFESYSAFGQKLRSFRSFADLAKGYPDVGRDKHGNGSAILLQLWSPSAGKKPRTKRIELSKPIDGKMFRFNIDGWALMQLYLGGEHVIAKTKELVVTKSHFGHNSFERARNWGAAEGVDWAALEKTSRKIQSILRTRFTTARAPGRPILGGAHALAKSGARLVEMASSSVVHEITWVKKRA